MTTPAATRDLSCLYSTVKNTSGGRKTFGFLPPHGRSLNANEEFTIFGHIQESLIRFERTGARRSIISFEQALERGDLDIIHTPNPILLDTVTGVTKMLKMTSGTLGVADPCWKTHLSTSIIGDDLFLN